MSGVVAPDRRYVLYKWHPVAKLVGTLPANPLVSALMCPDTRAPVLSFDPGVCITCDTIQWLPAHCLLSVCLSGLPASVCTCLPPSQLEFDSKAFSSRHAEVLIGSQSTSSTPTVLPAELRWSDSRKVIHVGGWVVCAHAVERVF